MGREVPHVIDEHGDEVSHAKRYFHLTVFVKVGSQTLPANIAASSKLLLVSARHFIAHSGDVRRRSFHFARTRLPIKTTRHGWTRPTVN